jgi:hypothetical protein
MSYVNVGAYVNGARPASKKALREAIAAWNASPTEAPSLRFDSTAAMGPLAGEDITAHDLVTKHSGHVLQVVGPDPYRKRNWYASVEVRVGGKLRLS